MKLVFRLLAVTCLVWGGCGDQRPAPSRRQKPALPSPPSPVPSQTAAPRQPETAPPKLPPPPAAAKAPAGPVKTELQERLEKMYPMPNYKPLAEIVRNWQDVPQKVVDAVKVVTVNVTTEYKLFVNGAEIGSSREAAGHRAKPLKYRFVPTDPANPSQPPTGQLLLTKSPDGNTKAVVNLDDTDFKERVQALYDEQVEKGRQRVLGARAAAEQALAGQMGGGEPVVDFGSAASDPRFRPAVAYLAAGKMITHTLDEAKQWVWLGKETHEGKAYDAILVHFETDTLFGMFPHSMKCLMENGRVVKWISAGYGKQD